MMLNVNVLRSVAVGLVLLLAGCSGGGGDKNGDGISDPSKLDESATYDRAIANGGFQFPDGIGGTTTKVLGDRMAGNESVASAAELRVVDKVASDSAGAGDLADFVLDVQVEGGPRYQAQLVSMATAGAWGASNQDFLGGAAVNVQAFGATGLGPMDYPEAKAYAAAFGFARILVDGTSIEGQHPVAVWATKAVHDESGVPMDAAAENRLELHAYFPGRALSPDFAIPGVQAASLYFVFTTVRLSQMDAPSKAAVGANLVEPQVKNAEPTAVISVLHEGTPALVANVTPPDGVNLTLDASGSSDPDGKIDLYAWDVREYKNNTTIEKYVTGKGETFNMNFTSPGWKLITLNVIDDRFGRNSSELLFYVNYFKTFSKAFVDANAVGGGADCQTFNCERHKVTFGFQAQNATFNFRDTSGVCEGPSFVFYAEGSEDSPIDDWTSSDYTIDGPFEAVGAYQLRVQFDAQTNCEYEIDTYINYAPPGLA